MKATFWAVAILAALLVIFLAFASAQEERRQMLLNPPTPTLGPRDRYVRFEIHGQGYSHITLGDPTAANEQYFDHLPWGVEFAAPSGQLLTFSAQDNGYGEITCQIYVSGAKVTETTSTGKYSTATCSVSVP